MMVEDKIEIIQALQLTFNEIVSQYKLDEKTSSTKGQEIEMYKREQTSLITCKEAAKLYPIGEQRFRELCRSKNKNFPSIKVGCRYYIVKQKLDDWFMENAIGGSF